LKQMVHDISNEVLEFQFQCTCCGDCCRGKQSVPLNAQDLILLAKYCGLMNTRDLFIHGFVEARRDANGYWRPFIRFRVRPLRMCPFLLNDLEENGNLRGLCALHPNSKPLVCHLAPIGRTIDLANQQEKWGIHEPSPGCPGMKLGNTRSLKDGLIHLKTRLDSEIAFFSSIEQSSPDCPDADSASDRLFSYAVAADQAESPQI